MTDTPADALDEEALDDIADFARLCFGQETSRSARLDTPPDAEADVRYWVAVEFVEQSERVLADLRRLRTLPQAQMLASFPMGAVFELHAGEISLPDWLDAQLPRLERAIADKRAGDLTAS